MVARQSPSPSSDIGIVTSPPSGPRAPRVTQVTVDWSVTSAETPTTLYGHPAVYADATSAPKEMNGGSRSKATGGAGGWVSGPGPGAVDEGVAGEVEGGVVDEGEVDGGTVDAVTAEVAGPLVVETVDVTVGREVAGEPEAVSVDPPLVVPQKQETAARERQEHDDGGGGRPLAPPPGAPRPGTAPRSREGTRPPPNRGADGARPPAPCGSAPPAAAMAGAARNGSDAMARSRSSSMVRRSRQASQPPDVAVDPGRHGGREPPVPPVEHIGQPRARGRRPPRHRRG